MPDWTGATGPGFPLMDNTYLFLLCPPFSGSTVLWQLIGTSKNVSSLPTEGQFLPEVVQHFRNGVWRSLNDVPWPEVRSAWHQYWDESKPILLEKSPPHLLRVDEILKHFVPSSFLVMVRDPYAHAEGFMRRRNRTATKAAKFVLRCLKEQRRNAERGAGFLSFTYEQLVMDPAGTAARIEEFLPALGPLAHDQSFRGHAVVGVTEQKLTNLNAKKMALLSNQDIADMNAVFERGEETLAYWGYSIYRPTRLRGIVHRLAAHVQAHEPRELTNTHKRCVARGAEKRKKRADRKKVMPRAAKRGTRSKERLAMNADNPQNQPESVQEN